MLDLRWNRDIHIIIRIIITDIPAKINATTMMECGKENKWNAFFINNASTIEKWVIRALIIWKYINKVVERICLKIEKKSKIEFYAVKSCYNELSKKWGFQFAMNLTACYLCLIQGKSNCHPRHINESSILMSNFHLRNSITEIVLLIKT